MVLNPTPRSFQETHRHGEPCEDTYYRTEPTQSPLRDALRIPIKGTIKDPVKITDASREMIHSPNRFLSQLHTCSRCRVGVQGLGFSVGTISSGDASTKSSSLYSISGIKAIYRIAGGVLGFWPSSMLEHPWSPISFNWPQSIEGFSFFFGISECNSLGLSGYCYFLFRRLCRGRKLAGFLGA